MQRKTGLSLAAVALVLAAAPLYVASTGAQAPPTHVMRIAVCDLTEVFARLRIADALERRFNQLKQDIEHEAQQRRKEIGDLQKELEAFPSGSADHRERRERLQQKQFEAEWWIRQKEARLREAHKDWFEKVYRQVQAEIDAMALQGGIDIVLADNPIQFDVPDVEALVGQIRQKNVIRAGAELNLTPDLIGRLDRAYEEAGGAAQIKVEI